MAGLPAEDDHDEIEGTYETCDSKLLLDVASSVFVEIVDEVPGRQGAGSCVVRESGVRGAPGRECRDEIEGTPHPSFRMGSMDGEHGRGGARVGDYRWGVWWTQRASW